MSHFQKEKRIIFIPLPGLYCHLQLSFVKEASDRNGQCVAISSWILFLGCTQGVDRERLWWVPLRVVHRIRLGVCHLLPDREELYVIHIRVCMCKFPRWRLPVELHAGSSTVSTTDAEFNAYTAPVFVSRNERRRRFPTCRA
jgi:hypothetical protein